MKIWVDADACPKVIKEILFRAAERAKIPVTFVTNQPLRLHASAFVSLLQVDHGPDVADDEIVKRCESGDLVITADIPLAARIVEKAALALDPRGTLYTPENVKQILNMRDFMDSLRGSGLAGGGPEGIGLRERERFSNELDRLVARR